MKMNLGDPGEMEWTVPKVGFMWLQRNHICLDKGKDSLEVEIQFYIYVKYTHLLLIFIKSRAGADIFCNTAPAPQPFVILFLFFTVYYQSSWNSFCFNTLNIKRKNFPHDLF